jgi:hypothetical protein
MAAARAIFSKPNIGHFTDRLSEKRGLDRYVIKTAELYKPKN